MDAGKKEEEEVGEFKMDIEMISKDKKNGKITFRIKNTNPAFANTLRRSIMQEVPTMAIEEVEFTKNSSALYDEIIAHRLGLMTLKTDLKSYVKRKDCKCDGEGCAKCTLKLTLKAKGPKMVYASDMKSADPKIGPAFPNTPITLLLKDQELEFEATASLGQGSDHFKFSPGTVFYKYTPVVEIVKQPKDVESCKNSCPKGVFDVKSGKLVVNEKKLFDCHLCQACVKVADGAIKLNEKNDDIIFTVESFGQMSPEDMVVQAIDVFDARVDEFSKLVKDIK